ncbi:hypothetical protein EB241_01470 [Erwinia psidii]|uniref:Uncharacterized protein n=1 Tax=Erwinia psidii TaxID=69224 RepID=A0A3N6SMA8_9GAMM|nr:hypothetical protein EB241_01470 [Erwinia psidii]
MSVLWALLPKEIENIIKAAIWRLFLYFQNGVGQMEHSNLPPDFAATSITWLKNNAQVIYGV